MFKRLPEPALPAFAPVTVSVDGEEVAARAGESVAALLLATGRVRFRSTPSGAPRGPYCMDGTCHDCVVTIDGRPNQRACRTPVAAGMAITT
jgi:predicted molibdopterin-dependent oxidoreductase YjgC